MLQTGCKIINYSSFSSVKYPRSISNKSHRSNEILYLISWLPSLVSYFLRKVIKVDLSFVWNRPTILLDWFRLKWNLNIKFYHIPLIRSKSLLWWYRVQILCFWTLSIILFLSKTSSCLYFKTHFGHWIVSPSSGKTYSDGPNLRRKGPALSIGPNWVDFTWRRRQNPVLKYKQDSVLHKS
jgi:hypothetical protein